MQLDHHLRQLAKRLAELTICHLAHKVVILDRCLTTVVVALIHSIHHISGCRQVRNKLGLVSDLDKWAVLWATMCKEKAHLHRLDHHLLREVVLRAL